MESAGAWLVKHCETEFRVGIAWSKSCLHIGTSSKLASQRKTAHSKMNQRLQCDARITEIWWSWKLSCKIWLCNVVFVQWCVCASGSGRVVVRLISQFASAAAVALWQFPSSWATCTLATTNKLQWKILERCWFSYKLSHIISNLKNDHVCSYQILINFAYSLSTYCSA